MPKKIPVQIGIEVYDRLEVRSQQLGLTLDEYVDKLFREMDQAPPTVETIIVEVEMTKGLYKKVKQFVETSDLAYDSITEFIEAATREYLLKMRPLGRR